MTISFIIKDIHVHSSASNSFPQNSLVSLHSQSLLVVYCGSQAWEPLRSGVWYGCLIIYM